MASPALELSLPRAVHKGQLRKDVGRAPLAALVIAGLACCRPAQMPPPPAGTLRIALRADVTGFFPGPPLVNEAFTLQANRSVYESLVRFDRDLRLRPGLAERWSNPDDRTYRFELRPGVRFSDGTPLTAADVVASLEANRARLGHPRLPAGRRVGAGDRRARGRDPDPLPLSRPAHPPALGPRGPPRGRRAGPLAGARHRPLSRRELGAGPRATSSSATRTTTGPVPAFARVVHTVVPDDAARMALVERGEADAADHVPLEEVERLSRNPAVRVVSGAGLRVLFLGLRVDRPPFSDPRVREAIDLALDREELVRRALGGRAEPATQLVPPSIVGFDPALRLPPPDPARARALLASAGHPHGLDVRLDGPSNRYVNDVAILRELARQLGEVGVRVTVNAIDKREFFPLIERGDSAMHLLGWACESGDAGDVLGRPAALRHGRPARQPELARARRPRAGRAASRRADRARTDRERARRLRLAVARVAGLRAALPSSCRRRRSYSRGASPGTRPSTWRSPRGPAPRALNPLKLLDKCARQEVRILPSGHRVAIGRPPSRVVARGCMEPRAQRPLHTPCTSGAPGYREESQGPVIPP